MSKSKKFKYISFIVHISMLTLGLIFPAISLLFLSMSNIGPLSFLVMSIANDFKNDEKSMNSDTVSMSFDTMVFGSHALVILLAGLLPQIVFLNVFVLNMFASMHYIAAGIDIYYSPKMLISSAICTLGNASCMPNFVREVSVSFFLDNLCQEAKVNTIMNTNIL